MGRSGVSGEGSRSGGKDDFAWGKLGQESVERGVGVEGESEWRGRRFSMGETRVRRFVDIKRELVVNGIGGHGVDI